MRFPPSTMGCGISRINFLEEGMACGLKRKIVQSRSKNDLLAKHDPSTASTKSLLKESDDNPQAHHVPDDEDAVDVMKEPPVKQQIQEKELSSDRHRNCEQSPMKKKLGEHKERGTEKEKKYETDDDYDGAEEDDDDGRRISNIDGNLIGSPSFREYCIDSESEDGAINHGDRRSGESTENKTRGMDNVVCVVQGPKSLEKKESRGRKFIKVFPMHRPKHFWNVTTCYSGNNHHVPSEKLPEKEV